MCWKKISDFVLDFCVGFLLDFCVGFLCWIFVLDFCVGFLCWIFVLDFCVGERFGKCAGTPKYITTHLQIIAMLVRRQFPAFVNVP